ncbi:MAG TPA: cob(I)yrinic acid a,c-diamide adenosyltransferase [Candidatus Paceibacterota bacterium]
MLYTGKGDDGSTYFFGSKERFGKDTPLVEALGTLDELNSLLGFVRARIRGRTLKGPQGPTSKAIIEDVQQNLFIIQAELAGADKKIEESKVREMEKLIGEIENKLPPIKTFFIPGANEESALLDFARTVSRRAERRVVALEKKPTKFTLAYLNRLSSLLYALARLQGQKGGKVEKRPTYK